MVAFLEYLPRGNALSDAEWKVRHTFLQWVLLAHLPALFAFGLYRGYGPDQSVEAIAAPAVCLVMSRMLRSRRLAGLAVTAGLSLCSVALVALSGGSIEAHFHFFATIGFIALYQDWVPFVWNAAFTTVSHGIGSWLVPTAFFSHPAGQEDPWTWAVIHGLAVLAACAGVMLLLRFTEDDHKRTIALRAELLEGNRKRFTADLLVNLARRNQNLIYRQLELLNRLEDHERDAEQLGHLFQLDHLATRIRRNAESLLVLSGEEPARKWGGSVLLVDVVRAAIAEIEELDRVDFSVDELLAVSGRAVADTTHLLAELIENAVHFSPPGLSVMVRTRPYLPSPGAHVLTIEDWGVGMSAADLADANDLLSRPREVDLANAQRLGLHVVARLAARYGIVASLESTPGGGVTAVVVLPAKLFTGVEEVPRTPITAGAVRTGGLGFDPATEGAARIGADGSSLTGMLDGHGRAGTTRSGTARSGTARFGPNAAGPNGSGRYGGGPHGGDPTGAGPQGAGPDPHGPGRTGHDRTGLNGLNGGGRTGPGLNGAAPDAPGVNGPGLNGHGLNGHGLDGHGLDGTGPSGAGLDGQGRNGTGSTGHGVDGHGIDGHGIDGHGLDSYEIDGHGLNGRNGHSANGPGRTGTGRDGLTAGGNGTGFAEPPARTSGPARRDTGLRAPGPGAAGLGAAGVGEVGLGGPGIGSPGLGNPGLGATRIGGPADAPLPAPRTDTPADTWSTWWPLPTDGSRLDGSRAVPAPSAEGGLARRTPQANLADELRRGETGAATEADRPVPPRRDPTEARSALSRFQATQRAAREGVRREGGEARP